MIKIGVDYYPEQWQETLWGEDIRRMKEAGVSVVRIAEFSWSRLEPREGTFDFAWLDKAVELLAAAGMQIVLGTPTNCPPLWMYRKYPETLRTEKDGKKTATGIRGHRCLCNSKFRFFAGRIITRMARRYGKNSAVIAWQIDNEIDSNHCCCPDCTDKFRLFLKEKYATIDRLNRAYGNEVWSGEYSGFEEILPPPGEYAPNWLNPSFMLDYERFASASTEEYIRFQRDILKRICPHAVITTNACFGKDTPDYYNIFDGLDVTAYDNYPSLAVRTQQPVSQSFILDKVRGVRRENFWIMEQMSGGFGCWAPMSPTPYPGMLKGYSLQAVAHGADTVLHFRWRTAIKGAEMFCHGILDHDNSDNRRFSEFKELILELKNLSIPENTAVKSPVAVLYSYEQEYAMKIQQMSDGFSYEEQVIALHDAFASFGVNVDVIRETEPLDGYSVVVVPVHFVTDGQTAENLKKFVASGGTALITYMSGMKDKYNACKMTPLPCEFSELCGLSVEEYDPIGKNPARIRFGGKIFECGLWCDVLNVSGAKPRGWYESGFYRGKPAVAENSYGSGHCWYLGTAGRELYSAIARRLLSGAGVAFEELPPGLERCSRENGEAVYVFYFNNSFSRAKLLRKGSVLNFEPFETKIFREQKLQN